MVDPLEALGVAIGDMQRGLVAVRAIEIAHPALDTLMTRHLEQVPVEAAVVIPFAPLAELAAHEQELLARVQPLVAEEQSQVGEALPVVAWHLRKQRALAVDDLVVR